MWTTDFNSQALCTSPDSLGSSNYLSSFCAGLGANWEHELTHMTMVLFSLPGCLTPQPSYPMANSECIDSSLLRNEYVLGLTAFSRIGP